MSAKAKAKLRQWSLQRARARFTSRKASGAIRNPCYFAMDATRPHDLNVGKVGARFYVICESALIVPCLFDGSRRRPQFERHRGFRQRKAVREKLRQRYGSVPDCWWALCNRRDENILPLRLCASAKKDAALIRSFVQFDGEGETANARQREIGRASGTIIAERLSPKGSAQLLRGSRRLRSVRATGSLRRLAAATAAQSWSPSDAEQIIAVVKDDPTALYIYPEAADIDAVTQNGEVRPVISRQAGLYWNASCLKEIVTPKFWPKEALEPVLAQYAKAHPAPPQRSPPRCKGR